MPRTSGNLLCDRCGRHTRHVFVVMRSGRWCPPPHDEKGRALEAGTVAEARVESDIDVTEDLWSCKSCGTIRRYGLTFGVLSTA
jgi:hypothetical protein